MYSCRWLIDWLYEDHECSHSNEQHFALQKENRFSILVFVTRAASPVQVIIFLLKDQRVWLLVYPTLPHKAHWCNKVTRNFLCESPVWVKAPPEMSWNILNQPSPDKSILVLSVNDSSTSALWCGRASMGNRCVVMAHTFPCERAGCITISSSQQSQMSHSPADYRSSVSNSGTKMDVQNIKERVFPLMKWEIIDTSECKLKANPCTFKQYQERKKPASDLPSVNETWFWFACGTSLLPVRQSVVSLFCWVLLWT